MKARSPVLGYNHNVRYGGRMWHVQTEDSGVQNPHIFTHLFADGTIIGSKKTNYDVDSEVVAVQKLMQTQHKLMLRDLKAGLFDEKIEKIFGPIVRDPGDATQAEPVHAAEAATGPVPRVDPPIPASVPRPDAPLRNTHEDERQTVPDLGPLLPPPAAQPPTTPRTAPRPQARLTPSARPANVVAARSTSTAPPPSIGGRASAPPPPRSAPPTIGSGRAGVPQQNRPSAEGVVVSRSTVIVGHGQKKGETADFWKTNERKAEPGFGENLISERSLDEVILAYLSEDAPKK